MALRVDKELIDAGLLTKGQTVYFIDGYTQGHVINGTSFMHMLQTGTAPTSPASQVHYCMNEGIVAINKSGKYYLKDENQLVDVVGKSGLYLGPNVPGQINSGEEIGHISTRNIVGMDQGIYWFTDKTTAQEKFDEYVLEGHKLYVW